MLSLTKEFGLTLLDRESPGEQMLKREGYFFGGKMRSYEEIITELRPIAAHIAADAQKIGAEPDIVLKSFDQLSTAEYFDRIEVRGWIRDLLDVVLTTEMGRETTDQTALQVLWLMPTIEDEKLYILGKSDERFKLLGGNKQIIDGLVRKLDNQIRMDAQLEAIRQYGNKLRLSFNRFEIDADAVIVAIPFSVLRQVEIDVELSESLRTFINELGYGQNAKVLAGFSQRIWRDYGYGGYFYTDEDFQLAWDNSQLQPVEAGGITFYTGGRTGLGSNNGTTDYQAQRFMTSLEKILPGIKKTSNGQYGRFHWPSYKFNLGSYSCYKPRQYTTFIRGNQYVEENGVSNGVGRGNLLFAGEHLSSEFNGYMNGAAQTGRLAAQALLRRLA